MHLLTTYKIILDGATPATLNATVNALHTLADRFADLRAAMAADEGLLGALVEMFRIPHMGTVQVMRLYAWVCRALYAANVDDVRPSAHRWDALQLHAVLPILIKSQVRHSGVGGGGCHHSCVSRVVCLPLAELTRVCVSLSVRSRPRHGSCFWT